MKYIKICPRCGSTNIKIPHAGMDTKMTFKDECVDCGEIGNFPEIEEDKADKFRKKIKK